MINNHIVISYLQRL